MLALNLMGSPGAGKTALLEATARRAAPARGWARSPATSPPTTTRGACSAPASRRTPSPPVRRATSTPSWCTARLHDFPWRELDVFFIENVGNLVCPAIYDLGQEANVVALSVTEGEDKPLKYPVMFQKADLVVLTKIDLVPHLDVDVRRIEDNLARVMPSPRVLRVSARTGEGLPAWKAWLETMRGPILAGKHDGRMHTARPRARARSRAQPRAHPRRPEALRTRTPTSTSTRTSTPARSRSTTTVAASTATRGPGTTMATEVAVTGRPPRGFDVETSVQESFGSPAATPGTPPARARCGADRPASPRRRCDRAP